MPLTKDTIRRAVLVAHARKAGFVELVGMAELDRATAFRGACLRRTDLRGQDLSGFDFTHADFDRIDVSGADLRRATGLTEEMFRTARFDAATQWPAHLHAAMQARLGRTHNFWPDGKPPAWADDWGIDQFGRWATFSVPAADGTHVTQRMRWIPPGRFTIGSPDDEPGRYDDEGPQQEITIADGFWLFDTPCTQALWQAVMGGNPSHFKSSTRPVEQVGFKDVQQFVREINRGVPGLNLSLPSEARWEYACRAGTTTPTYAGPKEIRRDRNAPVLDAIAWYGCKSGVGFELEIGVDFSDWYYEHTRGYTRPVGQKAANAWGLYDMLGNVWEWCADHWHNDYECVPLDGSAWTDQWSAAYHVVRGGSWSAGEHEVRAAYRRSLDPSDRGDNLGFRCARVQGRSPHLRADTSLAGSWQRRKRRQIIAATQQRLGVHLVGMQSACYRDDRDQLRVVCLVSRHHTRRRGVYWYGFKLKQYDFLRSSARGLLVLGCEDAEFAFAIPLEDINPIKEHLYTTPTGPKAEYWHLDIIEPTPGSFALLVPNAASLPLDKYQTVIG